MSPKKKKHQKEKKPSCFMTSLQHQAFRNFNFVAFLPALLVPLVAYSCMKMMK